VLARAVRTGNSTAGKGLRCSKLPASIRLFMDRLTVSQKAIQGSAPTTRKAPAARVGAFSPRRMANTTSNTR
jgi:hypothetical protein